jgi:hypothetical protein
VRFFYIILLVALVTATTNAQGYQWAKRAGGANDDKANCTTTDPSGNVIVVGSFVSPTITFGASNTLTNAGGGYSDVFITKYDSAGNVLWARSAGGTSIDYANSVTTDAAGNIYVTGAFGSSSITFGTHTLPSLSSNYDIFLVKYDPNGNALWAQGASAPFTSYDNNYGESVVVDAAGNAYMSGYFTSPSLTFGTTRLINSGSSDIFFVKFDTNGNLKWAKKAGGSKDDFPTSLTIDPLANVYLVGTFESPTITFGTTPALTNATSLGYATVFVVKFDSSGTPKWADQAGGLDYYDTPYSVTMDVSGNVIVAGGFESSHIVFGVTTLTNQSTTTGADDLFVVKYSNTGSVIWAKSAGGTFIDIASSVASDKSGNIFLAGYYGSPTLTLGTTVLHNNGGVYNDVFITKYNSAGTVIWANTAGGTSADVAASIAADASDNIIVAGSFMSSSIIFGGSTLNNASTGTYDMFVTKLCNLALPVITTAGSTAICQGDSVKLTSSTAYSYSWSTGATTQSIFVNAAGNYSVTITNSGGCQESSAPPVAVTMLQSPPVPTITPVSNTLFSSAAYHNQWYLNGTIMSGDTSTGITVTLGGLYTVVVTDPDGCKSTSQAYNYLNTGIPENTRVNSISVFPNPTSGNFILYSLLSKGVLEIYNTIGETVYSSTITNQSSTINLNVPDGVYFLRLKTEQGVATKKVLINQ